MKKTAEKSGQNPEPKQNISRKGSRRASEGDSSRTQKGNPAEKAKGKTEGRK